MKQRIEASAEQVDEMLDGATLTISDAAKCLGVGETAFRGALRRGEIVLPVITVGARRIIPTASVRTLLGIGESEREQAKRRHPSNGTAEVTSGASL